MAKLFLRQQGFQGYKINKISSAFLLTLLSVQSVTATPDKPKEFKHTFSVGLESFHYHYDEKVDNKKFMDIKGLEFGINGAYQLTYKDSFFVRPEGRVTYGFTEYSQPNDPMGNQPHIPDFLFETRFLTGWQFNPSKTVMIAPYTGIAYRQKENDGSQVKGKDNLGGRKRINKLWYVPLGLRGQYDLNNQWFIQGMVEYDWMLRGEQLAYGTDYYPSPLSFKQKKGYGLRGELLAGCRFDKFSVSAGPFVHFWNIEKTKEVQCKRKVERYTFNKYSHEPKNSTTEIGFKVNYIF